MAVGKLSRAAAALTLTGLEALSASHDVFRLMASRTPVGIFVASPSGEYEYVNESWCELAGLPPEKALGSGWEAALHPEDAQRVLQRWERDVAAGADSAEEYRFLKADGSTSRVESHVTAMRDDAGALIGWVGTCLDLAGARIVEDNGTPRNRPLQGRLRQRADRDGTRHARGNLAPGQRRVLPAARLFRGGAARALARRAHRAGRCERSGRRGRRDAARDALPAGRRHPDLGRGLDDPRAQREGRAALLRAAGRRHRRPQADRTRAPAARRPRPVDRVAEPPWLHGRPAPRAAAHGAQRASTARCFSSISTTSSS